MQDMTSQLSPLSRCLAELEIYARQYTGSSVMRGDRVVRICDASRYMGKQPDGRYAWRFGCEGDAEDFRDDAARIAQSHGLDGGSAIHPYGDLSAIVILELSL